MVLLVLAEASGALLLSPRTAAAWWTAAAERERAAGAGDGAPKHPGHNRTLNRRSPWGRSKSWAPGGGLAVGLESGPAVATGLGMGDELGTGRGLLRVR